MNKDKNVHIYMSIVLKYENMR